MADSDLVKLAQSIKQMREQLPALMEFAELQARLTRTKYNALLKEGFTEVQAIELCKTP